MYVNMLLVYLILIIALSGAESFKILSVFANTGHSHFAVFRPILEGLSAKGHHVTVLGYYPSEKKIPTHHDITVKINESDLMEGISISNLTGSRLAKYASINFATRFTKPNCEHILSSQEYRNLLDTNEQFDLLIVEFFLSNCALFPLVNKFKIPIIGLKSHTIMPWSNKWVGNPDNPAYIPVMLMDYGNKMTFLERTENTIILLYNNLYNKYWVNYNDCQIVKERLGQDVACDVDGQVLYNTSLILTNSHFSLHGSRPFVPNVVEIGGIHIGEHNKIPKNIEKWINESTHGVIYFSLGSMIKGHTFPEERRQMFLKAFARLPQRVLWKWETETMPNKPDNVMLQKWMPQFDILCHPNVKAFIAHGGLLGATEAVHCGVPMIVMPQFGDQFTNAKAIEASGGGVILDFRSADEESIYNALKTVLDPSFNKKAKELSARFRDRPLPPLETAIYWVEYVARHGGAPHLRTAAVGMPLYQYLLLDVVAFLAVILFIVSYVFYRVTRAVFRKIFKSKPKDKVKRN